MPHSLRELAAAVGADCVGDADVQIDRIAPIQSAGLGAISFISNTRYRRYLKETKASAVIISPELAEESPVPALLSDNPYLAYARVAAMLYPEPAVSPGVHPTAVVAPDAEVAADAHVGPHCVIGEGCRIGAGTVIGPGSVIEHDVAIGEGTRLVARVTVCHGSRIGARCLLHPGVVIGSDGFGMANDGGRWEKIPQVGRTVLGNDVEIGANTTVDRGALEDTVIEEGVKLDNQIQVAHNVRIGAHTAVAGCVGIAGSTRIGRHCAIGGGVGIVGHLEIADNVTVTAMSLVTKSIRKAGVYSSGTPLLPNAEWQKNTVRFSRLDELARRIMALEKQLKEQQEH